MIEGGASDISFLHFSNSVWIKKRHTLLQEYRTKLISDTVSLFIILFIL